ncbi:MAG TPA: hypothetical protein VLA89_05585 [Gemmatimonadales bacterium]|nr:hypothetical protein [Gemmatimonadales bacterium]
MPLDPIQELGPIGRLIIREASFLICCHDNRARAHWSKAPLRWCYERAVDTIVGFPARRYQ